MHSASALALAAGLTIMAPAFRTRRRTRIVVTVASAWQAPLADRRLPLSLRLILECLVRSIVHTIPLRQGVRFQCNIVVEAASAAFAFCLILWLDIG